MKKKSFILLLTILLSSCSFDFSIGNITSSNSTVNNSLSNITSPIPSTNPNSTTTSSGIGTSSNLTSDTTSIITSVPTPTTPTPVTSTPTTPTPVTSTPTTTLTTPTPSTPISTSTVLTPTTPVTVNRSIKMYGINDFHGAIIPNGYEGGIVKIGSFFKEKKAEQNTLLINSGDYWQGSVESNYNYGKLLTQIMNYIEFDCFTIGNHEFDWGQKYIYENRKLKDEVTSYQTPFLSSNIYKYDINTDKTLEFADFGEKYVIRTLENGLKVGIIGVIGSSQITSILSSYVDDITFINPINVIKDLSDELRTEHNVDVVIASVHSSQDDVLSKGITDISGVSNKRYVDAVFCAHTHKNEVSIENGVPFVQAAYNGRSYGEIELNVTPQGEISVKTYKSIYSSNINVSLDFKLQTMVNEAKSQSDELGNKFLSESDGKLYSNDSLMNLVTTAMYYEAQRQGYDVQYAITNNGRDDLASGTITYSKLYKSLPFDNEVYIMDVPGSKLKAELGYDNIKMYRADKNAISTSKTYRIAVIDYLALHRNRYRQYDYFAGFKYIDKLKLEGSEFYNYRDITADFLLRQEDGIRVSDFSSTLNQFNKTKITSKI